MFLLKFIRLIIFFIIAYFVLRLIQNILKAPGPKSQVKGSPKSSTPLDLSNTDVEDADFKDISNN